MTELTHWTLVEAAQAIAAAEVSSVEVTRACIARIEQHADALNCFISFEPELALQAAKEADQRRADGERLGPLHGVPLAHKDMFYRAGQISTCGSAIRKEYRPDVTATVIERLANAGALHLGTLNMAEFASGPTGHNAHFGACRNPWNTAYITCGSSSGSGSGVAGRLFYGALGSDTGGSIRLPAAACGLFGMKGTQTRVSRFGAMGLSFSLDNVGPLTRSARDCARMFSAIAGNDPRDPTSSTYPTVDYEQATLDPDMRGVRVGVPRNYFSDNVDSSIAESMRQSLAVLAELGAELVDVEIPLAATIGRLGTAVSGTEALALHRAWLRDRADEYGPQVRARMQMNLAIPAADYLATMQARPRIIQSFVEQVFENCDVLHCPVMPMELPTIAETDVEDQQGFEQLLANVTRFTRPFNFLGLPALSVPCGFTEAGLPIGFQVVGRPFAEARLFAVGAAYEHATGISARAPSL